MSSSKQGPLLSFAKELREGNTPYLYWLAQGHGTKCGTDQCVAESVHRVNVRNRRAALVRVVFAAISHIVAGVRRRCPKCFENSNVVKQLARQALYRAIGKVPLRLEDTAPAAAACVQEVAAALPEQTKGTDMIRKFVVRACGRGCKGPEPDGATMVRKAVRDWLAGNPGDVAQIIREASRGSGRPVRDAANVNGAVGGDESKERASLSHVTPLRAFLESKWKGDPTQIESAWWALVQEVDNIEAGHLEKEPVTHAAWMPRALTSVRTRPGLCHKMKRRLKNGLFAGCVLTFESAEQEFHANCIVIMQQAGKRYAFRYEPRGWDRRTYDWQTMDATIDTWVRDSFDATYYGPSQFQAKQAEQTLEVLEARQNPSALPQYGPCAAWCVMFLLMMATEPGTMSPLSRAKRAADRITHSDTDKTPLVTGFAQVLIKVLEKWRQKNGLPLVFDEERED